MPISDRDIQIFVEFLNAFPHRTTPILKARKILSFYSGMSLSEVTWNPAVALRKARAATHPDKGGNRRDWDLVEECARVLGLLST